jgi:hypothetical protein
MTQRTIAPFFCSTKQLSFFLKGGDSVEGNTFMMTPPGEILIDELASVV